MAKGFWGRFLEWQYYAHYLLTLHLYGLFLVEEVYFFGLYGLAFAWMILAVTGLIFLNDSVIHGLFWTLPKRIRWRD